MITFKEKDLVMVRLNNDLKNKGRQRHYNTWFRVMFVDNNNTFIGRVEKIDSNFSLYKIKEDVLLNMNIVQRKYEDFQQWCYTDNTTICDCSGLCRNK